ncbi:MAG: hypothetical protein ACOYNC_04570 [Bacteroidales bacterium]
MKIAINNSRKISAIQAEFNSIFPAYKIAFHVKPSHPGSAPSEKLVSHSSKTLQECRAVHNEGFLEVHSSMDIKDLEENFRDIFGLSVEIVPKKENGPIVTHAG